MADKPARDPRIEDDRQVLRRRNLARIYPRNGAFAGRPADLSGIVEIGVKQAAVEIVIAFHLRALAGDGADGTAEAGAHVAAGKAMRCDQHHSAHACGSAGAGGIGDARNRECRGLGGKCRFGQVFGRYVYRVKKIEIGV